jgi:predicted HTH transcriptional regulator
MAEDGCFIRVGASAQPMTEAMIERLLQNRQAHTLSAMAVPRQKLAFEQLRIYYSEHGLTLNDQFEDNLDLRNGDGAYNMLAYLLADNNGASVKVAKYAGTDKIDLIENEEYGYRCLITAVYRVLDKFAVENKTFAKITPRNRLERKLINPVALREAFINAVVHNDYNLGWPVAEFYSDRVTITSTGGLVAGLTQEDFFKGRSMLRNRELMRVFKDVELVEELGSGMRRILEAYDRSVFEITPSFIVVTFPYAADFERGEDGNLDADLHGELHRATQDGEHDSDQVSDQDSEHDSEHDGEHDGDQVSEHDGEHDSEHDGKHDGEQEKRMQRLLEFCKTAKTRAEMQTFIGISSRVFLSKHILQPLLESGKLKMTIPEKPKSKNQKYVRA